MQRTLRHPSVSLFHKQSFTSSRLPKQQNLRAFARTAQQRAPLQADENNKQTTPSAPSNDAVNATQQQISQNSTMVQPVNWVEFSKNLLAFRWNTIVNEQMNRASKLRQYLLLARIDKPIGTWLLLWPCLWSLALAQPMVSVPFFMYMSSLFCVGAFVMRGAGCTVNDLWDRNFDKMVERTRERPIASGAVSVPEAFGFLAAQLAIGLGVLLQLNSFCYLLGASSLFLVATYPLMKRFTFWPQAYLGLTFNWGAFMGFAALSGASLMSWGVTVPMYLAGICWTLVYDTIYAHQDKTDDVKVGVKSTALLFGERSKQILSAFATAFGVFMLLVGIQAGYDPIAQWPFFAGVLAATSHLFWQILTVNYNLPKDCMSKFVSNKWVGLILFVAILASNYLLSPEQKQQHKEAKKQATGGREETLREKLDIVLAAFGVRTSKTEKHEVTEAS